MGFFFQSLFQLRTQENKCQPLQHNKGGLRSSIRTEKEMPNQFCQLYLRGIFKLYKQRLRIWPKNWRTVPCTSPVLLLHRPPMGEGSVERPLEELPWDPSENLIRVSWNLRNIVEWCLTQVSGSRSGRSCVKWQCQQDRGYSWELTAITQKATGP